MKDRDLQKIADELDSQDMIGFTRNFIDDFETSISRVIDIDSDQDWAGVLCLGMGGSGAGGMFLSTLADNSGGLPFVVWRDYGLPSWWGPEWLVIATSYSGNTEETISGVREVLDSGGTVIGISSGGEMKEILSNSDGSLFVSVPGGQMPRSAFGHLFGTQLSVCWSLGIMEKPSGKEINDMIQRLRSSSIEFDISGGNGLVVTMAESMLDNQIGIIAPTMLISAARRFANQLNENSDVFARPSELPEMNHNEIVAWNRNSSSQSLLYLASPHTHSRVRARMNWMMENLQPGDSWLLECEGESLLESLLFAAHITDWVSIALAVMNGIDPSEMTAIDGLKTYLSTV